MDTAGRLDQSLRAVVESTGFVPDFVEKNSGKGVWLTQLRLTPKFAVRDRDGLKDSASIAVGLFSSSFLRVDVGLDEWNRCVIEQPGLWSVCYVGDAWVVCFGHELSSKSAIDASEESLLDCWKSALVCHFEQSLAAERARFLLGDIRPTTVLGWYTAVCGDAPWQKGGFYLLQNSGIAGLALSQCTGIWRFGGCRGTLLKHPDGPMWVIWNDLSTRILTGGKSYRVFWYEDEDVFRIVTFLGNRVSYSAPRHEKPSCCELALGFSYPMDEGKFLELTKEGPIICGRSTQVVRNYFFENPAAFKGFESLPAQLQGLAVPMVSVECYEQLNIT